MEDQTSGTVEEVRERRVVCYGVYDAITCSSNTCKWFQEGLRAMRKCLGLDSTSADDHEEYCTTTTPLIRTSSTSDHKNNKDELHNYTTATCQGSAASGSSSSSSSSSGGEQADPPPSITNPPSSSSDPPSSTDPMPDVPSVLAGRSRMPPRPPVSSGRGGQTN